MIRPTRVINIFRDPVAYKQAVDDGLYVLIMRPTKWGNPIKVPKRSGICVPNRDEILAHYEAWLVRQPELMAALHELQGRVLGCACAPKKCHGHVLARLADAVSLSR